MDAFLAKNNMNTTENLLAELKDLHQPSAISFWPPAIGWWCAAIVLGCLLVGLFYAYLKWQRRQHWHTLAQTELNRIETKYQKNHDPFLALQSLSILIKRILLVHHSRKDVAKLHGTARAEMMDHFLGTADFSQGIGKILQTGPYQKPESLQTLQPEALDNLFKLTRRWFQQY
jgi:Domain of unknown function (DUF4381)